MKTQEEPIQPDVTFFNSYLKAINDHITNHDSKVDFDLLQTIAEKIYNFYNLKLNQYLFSFENLKTGKETLPLLTHTKEHDPAEVLGFYKDIQALIDKNQKILPGFESYLQYHIQNISGNINQLPSEIKDFIASKIVGTPLELPIEVWQKIFSHLTPQELTRMSIASKFFNQFISNEGEVSQSFWKEVHKAFAAQNANANIVNETKFASVADYKGFFKKTFQNSNTFYLAIALPNSSSIDNELVFINKIHQQLSQGILPEDCKLFDDFSKAAEYLKDSYSFVHNVQNKKGSIIELQMSKKAASQTKSASEYTKILEEKATKIHTDPRISSSKSGEKVMPIKFSHEKFVKESDVLPTPKSPQKK